ncbi:MAG: PAS domain S-box protein [Raineya sp.]|jgi:PAS domain S-box-containing protein|nr:PAS domain S-box protein [Raineya sp.]
MLSLFPKWLLNSNIYSLCVIDLEGRYIFVNEYFKRKFGFLEHEIIGKCFEETIHPDDIEKCRNASYQCITEHNTIIEVQLRKPYQNKKEYWWTNWEFSLLKNEQDQILGILWVGYDITSLQEAQKQTQEIVQTDEHIFETLTDGFCILNKKWEFIKISDSAEQTFRIPKNKILGKKFWDIFPKNPSAKYTKQLPQAMKKQVIVQFEDYYAPLNVWFRIVAHPSQKELIVFFKDITEQKNAQEKLLGTKDKLEIILSTSSDSNVLIDKNYKIIEFNTTAQKFVEILYDKKIAKGQHISEYLLPDTEQDFYDNFEKSLKGEIIEKEREISFNENLKIWFLVKYMPFRDTKSNSMGVIFNVTHIDKHKRIEEKLKQSEYILKAIYHSSNEASIFIGKDLKIIYFNHLAKEITKKRFQKEIQIKGSMLDFVEHEFQEEFLNSYMKSLKGEVIEIEKKYDERDFLMSLVPVYDNEQDLVGVSYNIREISEIKKVEKQLSDTQKELNYSNQLLKTILESPKGSIIYALDKKMKYLFFTSSHKETMRRIWGIDIQLGGSMLNYIHHKKSKKQTQDYLQKALEGHYFTEIEEYGEYESHRMYWENRYSPIINEYNEIVGVTVFVTDITERRNSEIKVIQQNERLQSIAWQQSHGVRRPVANILGLIELLKADLDMSTRQEYLGYLKESAQQLDHIIHEIVEIANREDLKVAIRREYIQDR